MKYRTLKIVLSVIIGAVLLHLVVRGWDWQGMLISMQRPDGEEAVVGLVFRSDPDATSPATPSISRIELTRRGSHQIQLIPDAIDIIIGNMDSAQVRAPDSTDSTLFVARPEEGERGSALMSAIGQRIEPAPIDGTRLRVYYARVRGGELRGAGGAGGSTEGLWAVAPVWADQPPQGVDLLAGFVDFRPPKERGWESLMTSSHPHLIASSTTTEGRSTTLDGPLPSPPRTGSPSFLLRVRGINPWMLLPWLLIFVTAQSVRIVRWGMMLKPLGRVGLFTLFRSATVGFMAIQLLPFRLGEFVRPYLVSRSPDSKVKMSSALATCVTERLVDGVFVSAILLVVLLALPASMHLPFFLLPLALATTIGFLALIGAGLLLHQQGDRLTRPLCRLVGLLNPKFSGHVQSFISSFLAGLSCIPRGRQLLVFLGFTTLYWILNGLGFFILFGLCGLTTPDGAPPDLIHGYLVMGILGLGFILPAGPGFIGNFEFFVHHALSLFIDPAVAATRGAVYVIVLHALQLSMQFLIALPFLFLRGGSKGVEVRPVKDLLLSTAEGAQTLPDDQDPPPLCST